MTTPGALHTTEERNENATTCMEQGQEVCASLLPGPLLCIWPIRKKIFRAWAGGGKCPRNWRAGASQLSRLNGQIFYIIFFNCFRLETEPETVSFLRKQPKQRS